MTISIKCKHKVNDTVYAMYGNKPERFMINRIILNTIISAGGENVSVKYQVYCVDEQGIILYGGHIYEFDENDLFNSKSALIKSL